MHYLSSSEIAKKWGITRARVIILAKEGRVPGTKCVGGKWLIPDDAIKPLDKRYKKNNLGTSEYEYRFSLFMYGPYPDEEYINSLPDDEKTILEAQFAYCRCEYEACVNIIVSILDSITNIYHRISALYILCLASICSNNHDYFEPSMKELHHIFSKDFLYKEDYSFLMYDIYSMYLGNDVFIEDFKIDQAYHCCEDMLPLLYLQTIYRQMLLVPLSLGTDVSYPLELICDSYEQKRYYIVALRLHIYIGILHSKSNNLEKTYFHFKRAIDIGIEHDIYDIIPSSYTYHPHHFDKILEKYDPRVREKIQLLSNTFNRNLLSFLGEEAMYANKIINLTKEEHQLLSYAYKKLSNKTIAKLTGIPEYTIRRKYEKLFDKFCVSSKSALGEYYINILISGYK